MATKFLIAVVNMGHILKILVIEIQRDTLYDESGLVCYQYGNMGEITRETRIYTVPFLSNIIALSTQFEYDSWGRILNITYPDNEIVSYEYDCGGQLFRFYNNQNYTYLDSVQYNKFGAKISQKYGNGIQTKYTYYPLTQRLDSLLTTCNGNTLSYLQYNYDSVGNIIRVNSSYPMPQYQVTERYSYDSADQLLTAESTCNNNLLCSGAYSYNNWGKINTFTQQTTDPATNISENKNYRYYFPGSSADMAQGQTSFAPIIKYDMQQNPQPLETCTYGINGSIRKRLDHQTQNTDYYYFNASGNLKACGTDMQISLYGYNASNTRTYKVNMFNANQWVNGQPQPIQPMVQSAMFYPNTYINFTQAGEYTKHYYNGTERIASRLGEQQVPISVENEQELEAYQHNVKEVIRNAIGLHLYDEPTDMQEGDVIPLEFLQATGDNNAIFYYHPNHLASTMYVTDAQQSVVQSFLYAPYGEIISEYNTHAMGEAFPKYSFNAKELDEETSMYYYEARYYKPPTFISRDPLMSEKPWLTPYHYCSNNPIGRVDPSGMIDDWYQNEAGTAVFWREGNATTIDINGETYHNIGETYSCTQDNVTYSYNQNDLVSITEHVLQPSDYESQMQPDGSGKKPMPDGNCFVQSGKMVAKSGTTSFDNPSQNISNIQEGIEYINNQIDKGYSVRVHVDRTADGIGDHWVAISSRTINLQTGEISFGFYDPATRFSSKGTNNNFLMQNNTLFGSPSYNTKINYNVVNVRRNKNQ